MPLWVNLHGGFLAGIGAVGLALVGPSAASVQSGGIRTEKALVGHLAAARWCCSVAFAGSLFNPLGWRLWPYLATEFGHTANGRYLQEWQPVSVSEQPWTVCAAGPAAGFADAADGFGPVADQRDRRSCSLAMAAQLFAADSHGTAVAAAHSHSHHLGHTSPGTPRPGSSGGRGGKPLVEHTLAGHHRSDRAACHGDAIGVPS